MTRILSVAILCAVALPLSAYGQEAAPAHQVQYGYVVVEYPDGSRELIPPDVAAKQAEIERIAAEADARKVDAETEQTRLLAHSEALRVRNGTPAQPYYAEQVDDESTALFGGNTVFSTQPDATVAVATSKARKAKLEVIVDGNNRGAELAIKQTCADIVKMIAQAALEGKEVPPITLTDVEGCGISTGELPATVRALTAGNGVIGSGIGVPYGASPFQAVQAAGLGWQAVQAGQLVPPPVVVQPAPVVAPVKVVTRERVVTEPPAGTVEDAELAAAKMAIERAKRAAGQ
jgi:hypothetical protein